MLHKVSHWRNRNYNNNKIQLRCIQMAKSETRTTAKASTGEEPKGLYALPLKQTAAPCCS